MMLINAGLFGIAMASWINSSIWRLILTFNPSSGVGRGKSAISLSAERILMNILISP